VEWGALRFAAVALARPSSYLPCLRRQPVLSEADSDHFRNSLRLGPVST
jgi:hypothetical protein